MSGLDLLALLGWTGLVFVVVFIAAMFLRGARVSFPDVQSPEPPTDDPGGQS